MQSSEYDTLERIEQHLVQIDATLVGLRSDFGEFRTEHAAIHERELATFQEILRTLPTLGFRWPWEARRA